jgi:hypothetical protein
MAIAAPDRKSERRLTDGDRAGLNTDKQRDAKRRFGGLRSPFETAPTGA